MQNHKKDTFLFTANVNATQTPITLHGGRRLRAASKNLRSCLSRGDTHFALLSDIIFAKVLATEAAARDHRKDNQCDSEAGQEQAWSSQMELTHAASRRPTDEGDTQRRCTMAAHSHSQGRLIGLQRGGKYQE